MRAQNVGEMVASAECWRNVNVTHFKNRTRNIICWSVTLCDFSQFLFK